MKRRLIAVMISTALLTGLIAGCGKNNIVPESGNGSSVEQGDNTDDQGTGQETGGDDKIADNSSAEGSENDQKDQATAESATAPIATIINHYISCESEGKEVSYGTYPEIVLSDEYKEKYPNLVKGIAECNKDWEGWTRYSTNEYGLYRLESEIPYDNPFEYEIGAQIQRADDALFTVQINHYDFSGGAHPNHGLSSVSLDPKTGEKLMFADVLNDKEKAPQIIMDGLYAAYPDLVEEFDSYAFLEEGDTAVAPYERMLEYDTYTWSILTEGLHIYFSPYEVASYAVGYLDVVLPFDKYPDLVKKEYIPEKDLDAETMVESKLLDKEIVEVEEPESSAVSTVTASNKTWKAYTEDGRGPDDGEHIKLKKISEKKSEWLNTDAWADEYGFNIAKLPYSDGNYYYAGNMPKTYSYMYNGLDIYDNSDTKLLYSFDLGTLCNGPDEEEGRYSNETQFIRWAKMYDGVLYVSIIINGYSKAEPYSNYMVAIQPEDGYVLWRSDPLVCNSDNFQIIKDSIVCGYGFTDEPDYIYLLDRFTGQTMDKIKVNTAADQFEVVDDTLFVATYNTAYEFQIESE
jgi:hypothetical protein